MPEVNVQEFLQKVKSGKTPAVVLLDGSDSYMRSLVIQPLLDEFIPEASRAWAVTRFSTRDWRDIFERAQIFPMLSPHQVFIVDDVEEIESLGEEKREAALELLQEYVGKPAPFTILILQTSGLDKRQKLCKILHSHAFCVSLEVDHEGALTVAQAEAQKAGCSLDADAAQALVEGVNLKPDAIRSEIEKLALYKQKEKKITRKDVMELVVSARTNTVWQLIDMLISGNRKAALGFLENLIREGEQLPMIVGALAWRFRKLIEAADLPSRAGRFDASRILKMRPDEAEQVMRVVRQVDKRQLLSALDALYEADTALKSGLPNLQNVIEVLLTRMLDHPEWVFSRRDVA
jgi:DNA polymerase III subunit delta